MWCVHLKSSYREIDAVEWSYFIGTYKGSDYKDYITARTNLEGVQFIKELFLIKLLKNLI
jgi:hypothetical protein